MSGATPNELDIQVTTTKDVPQEDVRRARESVIRALAHAPRPVLYAKVTLSVLYDPAVPRPNLAFVRVDLNGRPVNAHAAAASMPEAISLAGTRLRARVENTTRYRKTHRPA
ncbi:hypothetical protein [Actinomadura welshii]|uniref:hypothetical protein n=1 Tax=Actinomadura welshii TaxID=3103817 RepID=UPI0003AD1EE0|nr:hypothetical protein [Actinomadura madurae]